MSLIVQKFGGSSVRDAERVMNVARIVTDTYAKGNEVVVVVSAQGDTTDDLIAKAQEINPKASRREKDMLLAAGEQISIALLAMAIEKLGYHATSLLGSHQRENQARQRGKNSRGARQEKHRGCRGLPGHLTPRRHHHARARRLRHQRGRYRGGYARRPLPDLHRR